MAQRRVLIVHGWEGSGPDHWQTWLADELRAAAAHVRYPELPDPYEPDPVRWGEALQAEIAALAAGPGERCVACHSLGSVLWLREAGRIAPERHVDRVALVAPPSAAGVPDVLAPFFGFEPSATGARETRVTCSDDDPYCPEGAVSAWAQPLGVPADVIPGAGHLNTDAGYGPWPAMRDWLLGARPTLA